MRKVIAIILLLILPQLGFSAEKSVIEIKSKDPKDKRFVKITKRLEKDEQEILFELCEENKECSQLGHREYTEKELMDQSNRYFIDGAGKSWILLGHTALTIGLLIKKRNILSIVSSVSSFFTIPQLNPLKSFRKANALRDETLKKSYQVKNMTRFKTELEEILNDI